MRDVAVNLLCLLGIGLVTWGLYLISVPISLIVLGVMILVSAYLIAVGVKR